MAVVDVASTWCLEANLQRMLAEVVGLPEACNFLFGVIPIMDRYFKIMFVSQSFDICIGVKISSPQNLPPCDCLLCREASHSDLGVTLDCN